MSVALPTKPRKDRWVLRNSFLMVLTAVPLYFLASWAWFRLEHTVSTNAVLKGHVIDIGPAVDGRLCEVPIQANQFVEIGDMIARMDDSSLRANLRASELEKELADKELAVERVAIEFERRHLVNVQSQCSAELDVAKSTRKTAVNELARWSREDGRIKSLRLASAVSESEKDQIGLAVSQAEASKATDDNVIRLKELQLDAAGLKLAALELRVNQLSLLEHRVKACEVAIERATAEIDATVIRSPVRGWVASKNAGPGSSVRVGDAILSVWEEDSLWCEAWLSESELGNLEAGRQVSIRLAAHPDRNFQGTVEAIGVLSNHELRATTGNALAGWVSSNEHQISVRIAMPRTDVRLMPGLSAKVGIHGSPAISLATWKGRAIGVRDYVATFFSQFSQSVALEDVRPMSDFPKSASLQSASRGTNGGL